MCYQRGIWASHAPGRRFSPGSGTKLALCKQPQESFLRGFQKVSNHEWLKLATHSRYSNLETDVCVKEVSSCFDYKGTNRH